MILNIYFFGLGVGGWVTKHGPATESEECNSELSKAPHLS